MTSLSLKIAIEITALVRPSSLQKPAVLALQKQGAQVVAIDLAGSHDQITKALLGMDVVISTIYGGNVMDEIPLINAAKAAGVKRYLPCFFATVAPAKGALFLREMKEDVLNHIKSVKLPYTVIDVGWWYQVNLPRLPSGRIDYVAMETSDGIAGDGNVPIAFIDLRDVGVYVARIIADPRTLNRMVLAYDEVLTHNQLYDQVEQVSGETLPRKYVTAEEIKSRIHEVEVKNPAPDSVEFVTLAQLQYWHSCGIRGDNNPENAEYLGYLLSKDLYPDIKGIRLETFVQEAIDGKGRRVYEHIMSLPSMKEANKGWK
ncbi:hypothetical protein G7Z17_g1003 [Cylindrodendrum hubeiense]|uniref:NmrA-like domain-containing protein n=1 Tax=Cylindrodendrum hubeiense TaxID=595255 RepID=A0A9P5HMC3_9HYPO|nr:hypothetical protein G7Z17_g1003 [Cylindrodendrum hubeiense]